MRRRFLNNINKSISDGNHSEYFTIEALEDGLTAQLSINDCEYRVDNGAWTTLSNDTNTVSINKGQTLSFKGNITPNEDIGIGAFIISKKCNLKGNIMSLLYGDDFLDKTDLTGKNYAFRYLFSGSTNIVDASNLILPATTLVPYCYDSMFYYCTSLVTAPELPATTLDFGCYANMFYGCTSLVTAPEILPATTLVPICYNYMFYGCTSLTTAPELPATTLVPYCYDSMFAECTSLTTVPELPATTLSDYCYSSMFAECTSLTTAPELPATTLAGSCYDSMFRGCTSLTTAPELPATTLSDYCYSNMFAECTSLTTAPELPATTLVPYCYDSMFQGCSKLKNITMLATDISASDCLFNWVNGVASRGTFIKASSMTSLPTGTDGIPTGWEVINR